MEEIISTAPCGYSRLRRKDYSDADLSNWAEKILSQDWKKAFVFFKHEDDTASKGPELAQKFARLTAGRI